MPTDKAVVEDMREEATVVFDDTMIDKDIDYISDPKLSLNFKDDGRKMAPRGGQQNLMCLGQRVASEKYRRRYGEMAWMCDDCGEMHTKEEKCKEK